MREEGGGLHAALLRQVVGEMCSGSEEGSYLRLIDLCITLIKKKKEVVGLHGARPVHLIITMIKWIRTSRLSIKKGSACMRPFSDMSGGITAGSSSDICPESSLLTVRIHFIIVMIRWTGLAPWEFEFPVPGSLAATFHHGRVVARHLPTRDALTGVPRA